MSRLRVSILALVALGASSAGAQNLFSNPDLDQDSDGWQLACGTTMTWIAEDEAGCSGSGAVHVTSGSCMGFQGAGAGQCLPIAAGTLISATGRVRAASGFVGVAVRFHDTADCSGTPLLELTSPPEAASGDWDTAVFEDTAPAGTVAVALGFGAVDILPVDADVDAGYAGLDPLVFRDGFEGDTEGEPFPCRWSDVVP